MQTLIVTARRVETTSRNQREFAAARARHLDDEIELPREVAERLQALPVRDVKVGKSWLQVVFANVATLQFDTDAMTPALVNGVLSPLLQSDLFADERWLLLRVFVGASVESLLLFDDGDAGWVQVTDSPKPWLRDRVTAMDESGTAPSMNALLALSKLCRDDNERRNALTYIRRAVSRAKQSPSPEGHRRS